MESIFTEARRILEAQQRAEAAAEADERKAGRGRQNRSEWMREYFREKRAELLDSVVPDRRCMCCGTLKVQPNQLTVFARIELAGRVDAEAERVRAASRAGMCATCIGCKRRHFPRCMTQNR